MDRIEEGENYTIVPGKHPDSVIIIQEDLGYLREKSKTKGEKRVHYLKCKFHRSSGCKGRAWIEDNFLTPSPKHPHTCAGDGATRAHWRTKIVIDEMKKKARTETSSLQSIYDQVQYKCYPMLKRNVTRC